MGCNPEHLSIYFSEQYHILKNGLAMLHDAIDGVRDTILGLNIAGAPQPKSVGTSVNNDVKPWMDWTKWNKFYPG